MRETQLQNLNLLFMQVIHEGILTAICTVFVTVLEDEVAAFLGAESFPGRIGDGFGPAM